MLGKILGKSTRSYQLERFGEAKKRVRKTGQEIGWREGAESEERPKERWRKPTSKTRAVSVFGIFVMYFSLLAGVDNWELGSAELRSQEGNVLDRAGGRCTQGKLAIGADF